MVPDKKAIRTYALLRMKRDVCFVIVSIGVMIYVSKLELFSRTFGKYVMIFLAVLCVPFIADCIELISGAKISAISRVWEHLEGWQRGVFGILVVLFAFAVFAFFAFTIAMRQP